MLQNLHKEPNWITRIGVGGVLSVAALGLVGCSDTTGTEEGTDVEDVQEAEPLEEEAAAEDAAADDAAVDEEAGTEVNDLAPGLAYEGVYDNDFYNDMESLDGQTVTVSANVNEIISDNAFTIAGTDETTVDSLLIVHKDPMSDLEPGLTVSVTGTVHFVFVLEDVEEALEEDFEDDLYEEWDAKPYITAESIDLSVPSEPEDTE